MNIEELNKKYKALSPERRIEEVYKEFPKVLFTSSFGTTSVLLIHLLKKINPSQEIFFLDTTYHFTETLSYKEDLIKSLDLNVKSILPEEWKNKFTLQDQTWKKDPDMCCSINKVEPLAKVKNSYDVWVSGLMAWQTSHRKQLEIFEKAGNLLKFHPVIDITKEQMETYFKDNNLLKHPLLFHGYSSVGCVHCTVKGKGREGRWVNKLKDECGLHL